MIRLSSSVCIDAPPDVVWGKLARLEDIELWSELIRRATCRGPISRGPGAERTCELVGNLMIEEHWIEWDEGRSFKYEGSGLPLVKRACNAWSVFRRMAPNSLAAFKYLVEHGRPYEGRHSDLPRAPATC